MNMVLHEMKSLRKSTVLWTCSLIAIAALYLSLYPGIGKDAEDFKRLLGGYPPAVRAMLGIRLDSITSMLGFYSFAFSFIALCGAIQGMNLGVSILSKESRERTADFLLVKPVSRVSIVTAKLSAAVLMLLATDVVFYAAVSVLANAVKTSDFSHKLFFMVNLTLLFLQLIFFSLGMAVSVFFKRLKSVLPLSLGVVFGLYLLGARRNDGAARYFSPFQYFRTDYILRHSAYESPYLIAGAAVAVVSILVAYTVYVKKDIHAVS